MIRSLALASCMLGLLAPVALAAPDPQAAAGEGAGTVEDRPSRSYIVQLADPPLVAYGGGLPGLPATRPASGQALDSRSPAALAYIDYLSDKQRQVLETLGAVAVSQRYFVALNGFSARLTNQQADQLRQMRGIVSVQASEMRKMDAPLSGSPQSSKAVPDALRGGRVD